MKIVSVVRDQGCADLPSTQGNEYIVKESGKLGSPISIFVLDGRNDRRGLDPIREGRRHDPTSALQWGNKIAQSIASATIPGIDTKLISDHGGKEC